MTRRTGARLQEAIERGLQGLDFRVPTVSVAEAAAKAFPSLRLLPQVYERHYHRSSLKGAWRGMMVTLTFTYPTKLLETPTTRVVAYCRRPLPSGFRLQAHSRQGLLASAFSPLVDVSVGEPLFDQTFEVRSKDQEAARALCSRPETRRTLLELFLQQPSLLIEEGRVSVEVGTINLTVAQAWNMLEVATIACLHLEHAVGGEPVPEYVTEQELQLPAQHFGVSPTGVLLMVGLAVITGILLWGQPIDAILFFTAIFSFGVAVLLWVPKGGSLQVDPLTLSVLDASVPLAGASFGWAPWVRAGKPLGTLFFVTNGAKRVVLAVRSTRRWGPTDNRLPPCDERGAWVLAETDFVELEQHLRRFGHLR